LPHFQRIYYRSLSCDFAGHFVDVVVVGGCDGCGGGNDNTATTIHKSV
jgi:hypothetical protein